MNRTHFATGLEVSRILKSATEIWGSYNAVTQKLPISGVVLR